MCSIIISAWKSVTMPAASRPTATKAGANIDAAISMDGRQPCPRWRIHPTIGIVIVAAMPISATAGAASSRSP